MHVTCSLLVLCHYSSYILAPYCPTCDIKVNSLITISLQCSACYTPMSLSSNHVYYFFGWESLPFHKLQFMLHVLKLNTFSPFCYCISYDFVFSGDRRVSCPQCMLHMLSSNLSSNHYCHVFYFLSIKNLSSSAQQCMLHLIEDYTSLQSPQPPASLNNFIFKVSRVQIWRLLKCGSYIASCQPPPLWLPLSTKSC